MNMVSEHLAQQRHRVTVAEGWAMRAKRIFGDADFEVIDGAILHVADDVGLTIEWSAAVAEWLFAALRGRDLVIVPDKTLTLSETNGPKPDFYIYPAGLRAADVRGPDVVLLIEVSDTTLKDDLGWKAELYSQFGVREYWVIDVNARCVHRHRLGPDGAYGEPEVVVAADSVSSTFLPDVALCLNGLRHLPPG
jgi:Uma2 family endonuclease